MARKTSLHGMLDAVEREAVEFLREHEPPEGYQLCFSGGKDSIVMRHLADMAGVKYTALFHCTTIDPPEVYAFIRRHHPDTVWHFPRRNFFHLVERKGPVWNKVRWCCTELKETGDIEGLRSILIGIRAEESSRRASRKRIEPKKRNRSKTLLAPIHAWQEWQIWEHIERWRLPYPPLYDHGYSRIGCKFCPLTFGNSPARQARLQKAKAAYPRFVARYEAALAVWFKSDMERRKATGLPILHENFNEFLASYYRGFE